MMHFSLHVICSCTFHAYVPFHFFFFFWVLYCDGAFLFVYSLFLLNSLRMAPKHKTTPSQNPLRSGASSSNSTPLHVRFCDEKAQKDFSENFSKHGVHSERRVILSNFSDTTLPTVIQSRGWESLCEIPVSCPTVIIQEFYSNMHGFDTSIPQFATCIRGTHIVVTPEIVSKVLHVPRVSHPDYPSCPRLRTVSKVELLSLFCETHSSQGDRQNTLCLGFAKGPRFLNMVMTFVLHLLSHYYSITEPRARFFLSLIEDLTITFPSHFILSFIDVYKDTITCDKLIFLLLSRGSSTIFLLLILSLLTSPSWVPSAWRLFEGARPSFN